MLNSIVFVELPLKWLSNACGDSTSMRLGEAMRAAIQVLPWAILDAFRCDGAVDSDLQ